MNDLSHNFRPPSIPKAEAAFLGLTVDTSHIPGKSVVSPQDVDLGQVTEVVMNAFNSRVAYVVISHGGVWGLGTKRYAAPWHALQYNNVQDVYVLKLTQNDIAELPSYESGVWPDFHDDCWSRETRRYYESIPFWMP